MNIVLDLDGTLADCTHRLHFITRPETQEFCGFSSNEKCRTFRGACPYHEWLPDWDAFFDACPADRPIQAMIDLAGQLAIYNRIEVWTGRPERIRPQTQRWLTRYLGNSVVELRMRANYDKRPDHEAKADYLRFQEHPPDIIFEDRESVVEMWRRHGILCCQVADGKF